MTGANSTAQQTPACISDAELFMDELLEDPSLAQTREERRRLQLLTAKAEQNCLHCPLLEQCLYDAVVKHEVAGYCAGTTQRQRQLRKERRGESIGRVKLAPVSPSVEQVMAAYQDVMGVREQGRRAA